MMITVENNHRAEIPVSVPRVQCKACGHSHSFLSDNLIPFSSYTLRFVLTVLSDYLEHSLTVKKLCSKWQIAVSTLYVWISLFSRHYSLWNSFINEIIQFSRSSLDQVLDIPAFPSAFYRITGFSFMQLSERCASPTDALSP